MKYSPLLLTMLLWTCAVGCGSGDDPKAKKTDGGVAGKGGTNPQEPYDPYKDPYGEYAGYDIENITFADVARSNAKPGEKVKGLEFVDRDGQMAAVEAMHDDKPLVLLVMRGNTKPICPFCSTQTANYVARYDEIEKRGAHVVLAYPVALADHKSTLEPFLADARERLKDPDRAIPFPIVFDVELAAVKTLGIKDDLSKPATYILDREGRVRFAYVGRNRTDRPSVTAVIAELDKLAAEASPGSDP